MSNKFRIRVTIDSVSKSMEFDRGQEMDLNFIKSCFEKSFGEKDLALRFKNSSGRTDNLYQNIHLENAVSDSEKSGAKYVMLQASGSGRTRSSSGATSVPTNIPTSPRQSSNPTSPGQSTNLSKPNVSQSSAPTTNPKYCEQCGTPLPSAAKFCSSCGAVTVPINSPRQKSDEETCAGCKKSVSSGVRAMEKLWHKECFICKNCKKSLLEGTFVPDKNGNPTCGDCYDNEFGQRCFKCNNLITGVFVNIDSHDYHKECFVCNSCGSTFEGGYFMKNGNALCKNCI